MFTIVNNIVHSYSATAAVLYSDSGGVSYPGNVPSTPDYIPPFFTSTVTKVTVNVAVTLTGTINVGLSFGTSFASVQASFASQVLGTTELAIQYIPAARRLEESPANRDVVTISHNNSPLHAGDSIHIKFYYEHLPPGEKTVLFYFLIINDDREYEIMQKTFYSNLNRTSDYFLADYVIPWNEFFASNGSDTFRISVRSSSHISSIDKSSYFTVEMFTEKDSIFTLAPVNGAVVDVDTPLLLEWDPKLLHYFFQDRRAHLHGDYKVEEKVFINLISDSMQNNKSVSKISTNIENNGRAYVTIPNILFSSGSQFYLTLNSLNYSDVWGWFSGYFTLRRSDGSVSSSGLHSGSKGKHIQLLNGAVSKQQVDMEVTETSRNLQTTTTCTDSSTSFIKLTSSVSVGGSVLGGTVKVLAINLDYPISSITVQPTALIGPIPTCFPFPAASDISLGGSSSSDGMIMNSLGMIIGVTVGGVVLLLLLLLGVYYKYYHVKQTDNDLEISNVY